MEAYELARHLRGRFDLRIAENHRSMDRGLEHEHYLKLVAENKLLGEMLKWLAEDLQKVDGEGFDDDD